MSSPDSRKMAQSQNHNWIGGTLWILKSISDCLSQSVLKQSLGSVLQPGYHTINQTISNYLEISSSLLPEFDCPGTPVSYLLSSNPRSYAPREPLLPGWNKELPASVNQQDTLDPFPVGSMSSSEQGGVFLSNALLRSAQSLYIIIANLTHHKDWTVS